MNTKEIQELIKLLDKSNVAEFKMKQGDFSITIRSKDYQKEGAQVVYTQAPNFGHSQATVASTPSSASSSAIEEESKEISASVSPSNNESTYVVFKSPMVGTFYRKPSPDKEPFVKVGDKVNKGDVLAVIEAMKLFNEIESEFTGTIVKVLVDDQTPVEYDQALFLIDPA
jgi:acetyl-CoA carboxylase biotin carboxyl carrier protein